MIIQGDALTVLKRLEDNSVHCCITSPPYYGLRKYGTTQAVWGGEPSCDHVWIDVHPPGHRSSDTHPGPMQHDGNKHREGLTSKTCSKCGAWKGELGLEPTPEMYVAHLVEIFREVRRVLRKDGLFWLNIGDSYSAKSTHAGGNKAGIHGHGEECGQSFRGRGEYTFYDRLKPKDLLEVPSMIAVALRADGWYLRSRLPWLKRNSMPSSVEDRPAASIEYVFLLSKSRKYFYDRVGVLQSSSESYNKDKRPRGVLRQRVNKKSKYPDEGQFKKQDNTGNPQYTGFNERYAETVAESGVIPTRNLRDSDLFFKTWQGLLHNEDGEPIALVINTRSYKGAHFATFPPHLVEPMVVASTSEKGYCPVCGAPWERIFETDSLHFESGRVERKIAEVNKVSQSSIFRTGIQNVPKTTSWQPTCKCTREDTTPGIVLDPFAGSGTTEATAIELGREGISIELNADYCTLAAERIKKSIEKMRKKVEK